MVKSICHRRLLGLTPASQASCVVPCFVPFPAQMGPPGCTEFCDKPHPPGGARSMLRASLWSAELRPVRLFPWLLCLRVHVPRCLSSPPTNRPSFGDGPLLLVKWAANLSWITTRSQFTSPASFSASHHVHLGLSAK